MRFDDLINIAECVPSVGSEASLEDPEASTLQGGLLGSQETLQLLEELVALTLRYVFANVRHLRVPVLTISGKCLPMLSSERRRTCRMP
jgi:hypothetical protein